MSQFVHCLSLIPHILYHMHCMHTSYVTTPHVYRTELALSTVKPLVYTCMLHSLVGMEYILVLT